MSNLEAVRAKLAQLSRSGMTPVRVALRKADWLALKAEYAARKRWRVELVTGPDVFGVPVDQTRRQPGARIIYDGGSVDVELAA